MTYLLEIMNRAALRPNGNLFFPGFFFFAIFLWVMQTSTLKVMSKLSLIRFLTSALRALVSISLFYCYKKLSQGSPSIPSSFPSCELNPKSFKFTSHTFLGSRQDVLHTPHLFRDTQR